MVQLPTKMQALKLFWFFKDEMGRTNTWWMTNGDIEGVVARVIIHYWRNLAAYDTVDPSTETGQEDCRALSKTAQDEVKESAESQQR